VQAARSSSSAWAAANLGGRRAVDTWQIPLIGPSPLAEESLAGYDMARFRGVAESLSGGIVRPMAGWIRLAV
jgi:hypothetical protein